jgi:[ribosomal protein S18]-alanine N-acetyltransferase
MGANIRLAGPVDAGAIVGLLAEVAAENRWIRTEVPFDVALREERTIAALAAGTLVAFIAEADSRVVGELSLRFRDDRAAFGMLVAATHRGQGVGRQLLSAAIAEARERSAARIELEVYAHNTAALALYRAFGFSESGPPVTEERADGQRWQAVPMTCIIRSRT